MTVAAGEEARSRQALVRLGNDVRAAEALAQALWNQGRTDEALAWYRRALASDPSDARSRLGACIARLPALYDDMAAIDAARSSYAASLKELERWSAEARPEDLAAFGDAVGAALPFYLAYQGMNDRPLQSLYGRLVGRALAARLPSMAVAAPALRIPADRRLRIGLVSGFFRRHSVWKMALSGWVEALDRSRFALFGYHTSSVADDVTRLAAERLDGWVVESRQRAVLAQRIAGDRLDVVLYPEIGMDPVASWLAALRLAPVQMMSWGHPTTSGYAAIDCFLSSDLMEPPDAQDHYTERLVRLPGLGCLYRRIDIAPAQLTRADIGVSPDDIVYLCAQSLYKYLPQHDGIFVRIADAVPKARFVFFSGKMPSVTTRFSARLARRLGAAGHDPGRRLVFLPSLTEAGFLGVGRLADILLDTIGWSGFNTTIEVIAAGVPVVAVEGATLRGRHTSAALTRIGCQDMVADDETDYVRRAIRLGHDADHRRVAAARIAAAAPALFDDASPIRALEAVLETACRGRS